MTPVFGHPGTGLPAVLTDVFVARLPAARFQRDGRVLIQRGELGLSPPFSCIDGWG
jgi:hypothetical protein